MGYFAYKKRILIFLANLLLLGGVKWGKVEKRVRSEWDNVYGRISNIALMIRVGLLFLANSVNSWDRLSL